MPALSSVEMAKLRPPTPRTEWIDRPRLLQQLSDAVQMPVTLVAAPAGYGKSTLIAQWFCSRDTAGHTVWVTLDAGDNDPTRLWTHIASALERIGCWHATPAAEFVAMNSTALSSRVIPRLCDALSAGPDPISIVLDDCHVIRSSECCAQLDQLIEHLPSNAHLVLASRSDPALRLGRLRVDARLAEIRLRDLAFTTAEVETLLRAADIRLENGSVTELERRTEGWPAAVHLSVLALTGRADPDDFVHELSGNNRFIADYLSEEVLNAQTPELRAFILDLSVFDRFTASLGDHVTETHAAFRLIRDLERANIFLVPLDGAGKWYRFHHLFASFARSALAASDSGRSTTLHLRGSEWFAAHGRVDEAVQHALAASATQRAADLVQANWLRYFDAGRSATVLGWLATLADQGMSDGAVVTVTAAWMAALTGQRTELRRRLSALERITDPSPLPDGTRSARSALLLIRGLFGFDGPAVMLSEARRATELEDDDRTPWYAAAQAALGHATYVVGDLRQSAARLASAAAASEAPVTVRVLAVGTLSLCLAESGDLDASTEQAEAAMALVRAHALRASPQSVFAYTALGAARAAAGWLEEATDIFDEGLRIRRQVPGLSPWPLIHHLIAMSRATARVGHRERAERLLAEARDLCSWSDDSMAAMRTRLARAASVISPRDLERSTLGESLTPRELEVLEKLAGTGSLAEIAAQLFVSRNTIKTLTSGLYRKLGVHSRPEAVAAARRRHLL
ncbi:LuxR C-terminal-related transcriptional regulator [Microlunatus ginsengisoli]|uniref:LuxR C-terminal-related transcriptional regulator n=1 Tax=Microlunatus ginsengisoli TaxID=363863 RepID=A0ABP7ADY1_9ACTN